MDHREDGYKIISLSGVVLVFDIIGLNQTKFLSVLFEALGNLTLDNNFETDHVSLRSQSKP